MAIVYSREGIALQPSLIRVNVMENHFATILLSIQVHCQFWLVDLNFWPNDLSILNFCWWEPFIFEIFIIEINKFIKSWISSSLSGYRERTKICMYKCNWRFSSSAIYERQVPSLDLDGTQKPALWPDACSFWYELFGSCKTVIFLGKISLWMKINNEISFFFLFSINCDDIFVQKQKHQNINRMNLDFSVFLFRKWYKQSSTSKYLTAGLTYIFCANVTCLDICT